MNWRLFGAGQGKPATVWPLNDLREHDPDNQACWCRPRWDDGVLVHNAMDRREVIEQGGKLS